MGAALQLFISRVDAFLGTELFGADLPVTIGRHRDSMLRLDDDTVSRSHCRLLLEGRRVFIEDAGSANGTLVNRRQIEGRIEIRPTDAVQIGNYTIKVRPLIPSDAGLSARPTSDISEKTTRLKAILSADGTSGTSDASIDLGRGVDWRLYEAAVRRATGAERAENPIPFVVVDGGRRDSATARAADPAIAAEMDEHELTARNSSAVEAILELPEIPTSHAMRLDPRIDQRIDELDQMMRRLERAEDPAGEPKTVESRYRTPRPEPDPVAEVFAAPEAEEPAPDLAQMGADTFARYLALELARSAAAQPAEAPVPEPRRGTVRQGFAIVPSDRMVDAADDSEEDTLGDEDAGAPVVARTPSIIEVSQPRADSNAQLIAELLRKASAMARIGRERYELTKDRIATRGADTPPLIAIDERVAAPHARGLGASQVAEKARRDDHRAPQGGGVDARRAGVDARDAAEARRASIAAQGDARRAGIAQGDARRASIAAEGDARRAGNVARAAASGRRASISADDPARRSRLTAAEAAALTAAEARRAEAAAEARRAEAAAAEARRAEAAAAEARRTEAAAAEARRAEAAAAEARRADAAAAEARRAEARRRERAASEARRADAAAAEAAAAEARRVELAGAEARRAEAAGARRTGQASRAASAAEAVRAAQRFANLLDEAAGAERRAAADAEEIARLAAETGRSGVSAPTTAFVRARAVSPRGAEARRDRAEQALRGTASAPEANELARALRARSGVRSIDADVRGDTARDEVRPLDPTVPPTSVRPIPAAAMDDDVETERNPTGDHLAIEVAPRPATRARQTPPRSVVAPPPPPARPHSRARSAVAAADKGPVTNISARPAVIEASSLPTARPATSARPAGAVPAVRARRVPGDSMIEVPPAIVCATPAPAADDVPRPPPLPHKRMREALPRVTGSTPRAPMADRDEPPAPPVIHTLPRSTPPAIPVPVSAVSPARPLPTGAITPLDPRLGSAMPRRRRPILARLVTPTAMRISVGPAAPSADDKWSPIDSEEILSTNPSGLADDEEYTEALAELEPLPQPFDAVEISARADGRLLDIATLRHEGEQYVLGHRTPQGPHAPHCCHTGLRLLRISEDRSVDLVFPADAAGHLVRDGETVMFTELAQGRKYSCLRMSNGDVATVILSSGDRRVSYHIRFLRRPRLA